MDDLKFRRLKALRETADNPFFGLAVDELRRELADQIASTAWTNGYGYNFRNIYKGYAAVAEITAR